jgi:regulator of sirC expression with transglutaminase-like and TPR domain
VTELKELLAGTNESHMLDVAALQLAAIEFPGLDATPFLEILDSYGRQLAAALPAGCPGAQFVSAANRLLFEEEGFHGNEADYYHPRNSCLNEVIATRSGIPITLSLVYMEIARRLNRNVTGIGLPGHFLVRYQDEEFSAYVDPFHKGRILSVDECRKLAIRVARVDIFAVPSALEPVTKGALLHRMLNNLRNAYYRRNEIEKAIRVHDLLIDAMPAAAVEYRQRAALLLQQAKYRAALLDLAMYLRLSPHAPDRTQVEKQINELKDYLRSVGSVN